MLECCAQEPGCGCGFGKHAAAGGDCLAVGAVEVVVSCPSCIAISKLVIIREGERGREIPHMFSIYADELAVRWMSRYAALH